MSDERPIPKWLANRVLFEKIAMDAERLVHQNLGFDIKPRDYDPVFAMPAPNPDVLADALERGKAT